MGAGGVQLAPWEETDRQPNAGLAPWEEAAKPAPSPAGSVQPARPRQPDTVQAAPPLTWAQRVRQAVANSNPGQMLERAAPSVASALGLEPTETEAGRIERHETQTFPYHPIQAASQINKGMRVVTDQDYTDAYNKLAFEHPDWDEGALHRVLASRGVRQQTANELAGGANQVIGGALEAAKPLVAAGAAAAPVRAAAALGTGYLAQRGGQAAAKELGATPNEAEFVGNVTGGAGAAAGWGAIPNAPVGPDLNLGVYTPRERPMLTAGEPAPVEVPTELPALPAGTAPWEEARALPATTAGPAPNLNAPPPVNPATARMRVAPPQYAPRPEIPADRGVIVDAQGNALVSRPGLPPPGETAGRVRPIIPKVVPPPAPVQTAPTPQLATPAVMARPAVPEQAAPSPAAQPPTAVSTAPQTQPEGQRPIVQASTEPAEIRQSAQEQKPVLADMAQTAVEPVPGAQVEGIRVKSPESVENKEDRGKPPETNIDHLGARVSVPTPADVPAVQQSIESQLPVVSKEKITNNGVNADQYGIQTGKPGEPNQVSELQVVTKPVAEAMKATDDLYAEQKKALAAGDTAKADELGAQIAARMRDAQQPENQGRAVLAESPEQIQLGNPKPTEPFKPVKGTRVQMGDGRLATVTHVDSRRGMVGIKLDDGRQFPVVPIDRLTRAPEITPPTVRPAAAPPPTSPVQQGQPASGPVKPVGNPIPARVEQIKQLAANGQKVVVFSAEADNPAVKEALTNAGLGNLPVTNIKGPDFGAILDNDVNVKVDENAPMQIPPVVPGKALYVDFDGTLFSEPKTGAQANAEPRISGEPLAVNAPEGAGKEQPSAIQKPSPEGLLPREQEQTPAAGSERGRVESGQQGAGPAGAGTSAEEKALGRPGGGQQAEVKPKPAFYRPKAAPAVERPAEGKISPVQKRGEIVESKKEGPSAGKSGRLYTERGNDATKALAIQAKSAGLRPEEIWDRYGWFEFGGKWRSSIPFGDFEIKQSITPEPQTLGEVLHFPELFKIYPQARNVVVRMAEENGLHGGLSRDGKEIILSGGADRNAVLKHEIQHLVQLYEERAPTSFYGEHISDMMHYFGDPAEVEARESAEPTNRPALMSPTWQEVFARRENRPVSPESFKEDVDDRAPALTKYFRGGELPVESVRPVISKRVEPEFEIKEPRVSKGFSARYDWSMRRLIGTLGPKDPRPITHEIFSIDLTLPKGTNAVLVEDQLKAMGFKAFAGGPTSVTVEIYDRTNGKASPMPKNFQQLIGLRLKGAAERPTLAGNAEEKPQTAKPLDAAKENLASAGKTASEATDRAKKPTSKLGTLLSSEEGSFKPQALVDATEPLREALESYHEEAIRATDIQKGLAHMERANHARQVRVIQTIERLMSKEGFTPEDGRQVFRHIEDPSVKLTPKQAELRDKWIKPMDEAARQQYTILQLIQSGKFSIEDILAGKVSQADIDQYAPLADSYAHRIAAGHNTQLDRIMAGMSKGFGSKKSVLSRALSSAKHAVFHEAHSPSGQREVVAIKGGRVRQFVNSANSDVLDKKIAGLEKGIQELKTQPRPDQDRIDRQQQQVRDLKAKRAQLEADGIVTIDLGAHKSGYVTTDQLADEAVKPLEGKLSKIATEERTLRATPSRQAAAAGRLRNIAVEKADLERQIAAVRASVGPEQAAASGMSPEAILDERLRPVQAKIAKLTADQQKLNALQFRTPRQAKQLERIGKRLKEWNDLKGDIEDQHASEGLQGRYWRDKYGHLWQFNRGTTEFISSRTGQKYYDNAMLSSQVNYLETSRAAQSAITIESQKAQLEKDGLAIRATDPSHIPDGWHGTQLMQMRGMYFPSHIADAYDQFAEKLARGVPDVLDQINRFNVQMVLMNPLMHGKNVVSNWVTGKLAEGIGSGRILNPVRYVANAKAGIRALNAVWSLNEDYLHPLENGLDLLRSNPNFDSGQEELVRSLADHLALDKETMSVWKKALHLPGNGLEAIRRANHTATFGINDLFVLQAYYSALDRFTRDGNPDPEGAARDWAHRQVIEYRPPIRFFGSRAIARTLENPKYLAFWPYHSDLLRQVATAVGEAAGPGFEESEATPGKDKFGQTPSQARANGLAKLAVMGAIATALYPLVLDPMAKMLTGDERAKAPRGGVVGLASNIYESVKGERDWGSTVSGVFTPALGTENLAELIANRDFFTGRHLRGTDQEFQTQAKQLGDWLVKRSLPGQFAGRIDQNQGQQAAFSLLGFTFPMEHGLKEAAEIRRDKAGSNPPDPQKSKVFQSVIAAAEQARRSFGQDTRLADALELSGKLSLAQEKELEEAIQWPPIVFAVNGMDPQEVYRVFEKSTDQEKRDLLGSDKSGERLDKYLNGLSEDGDDARYAKVEAEFSKYR